MARLHRLTRLLCALMLTSTVAHGDGLPADLPSDPEGIADYLDAILDPSDPDVTKLDRYDDIWDQLPASVQDQVNRVWERRDESFGTPPAGEQVAEQQRLAVSGQDWAQVAANFFINAFSAESARAGGGELSVRAQVGSDLLRAQAYYGALIETLQEDLQFLVDRREVATARRDIYQEKLDQAQADFGFWDLPDLVWSPEQDFLENRIEEQNEVIRLLRGQIATTSEELQATIQAAERYQAALIGRGVRNDAQLLSAEQDRRFHEAVGLNQEIEIKKAQYVAGHKVFESQLAAAAGRVEFARDNGLDATQFERDRQEIARTLDVFQQGLGVQIERRGNDLAQALSRNQHDGIGPGDVNALMAQAVERGLDIAAVFDGGDARRVAAAEQSAGRYVQGSLNVTTEEYGWRHFLTDYRNEFRVTVSSPDKLIGRLEAYQSGVEQAGRDVVTDIVVLGAELVDTAGEAVETSLNYGADYTGIRRTNVFGRENLEAVEGLYHSGIDSETIYSTTQGIIAYGNRRLEQTAGSGEAGIVNAMYGAGYVATTVIGPEGAILELAAAPGRYARAANAIRLLQRGEQAADIATDTARAASAVADVRTAERVADAVDTAAPPPGTGLGGRALPDAPTPAVFDPRPLAARRNTDGSITLTREGGTPLTLTDQHKLGSGGTTDAYAIPLPGGENYVIKITRGAFDGNLDLIRETAAIDDFGMQAMRSLQSDVVEVPGIVSRYRATGRDFEGMVVTVARRVDAPSFEQVMRAEGRFDMTPEEATAFDRFMREMADNGYVWADNKGDNFAFVRGLDGELRVSPFDFGGTLKFDTPEAAHAFRAVLDNPTAVLAARIANPRDAMNAVKYELAAFDEMVDWKFMNDVMGTQFDTTLDFPYLPHSGLNYPTLRAQVAGADAARATPAPSVTPSPAMSAGPGPARFESPALIRFFPSGGVPDWGRRLGFRPEDLPSFLNREPQAISGPLLHGYPGAPRTNGIPGTGGSTPIIAVGRPGVALELASRSPRLAFHIGGNATLPEDREVVVIDSNTVDRSGQPDPAFEFTEPDHARFEQGVDPLYATQQWALQRVGVPQMPTGALRRPVTVAVIDTGLAWAHPDFRRDSLWINTGEIPANYLDDDGNGYIDDVVGWNFVDDNNLPWDTDGHGTVVAGIIAAAADNDEGIRGVNPAVRIMPLRALDGEGRSRASLLSEAIVYAANNGADVINLSVGGIHLSRTEQLAIDYARGKGALLVVAAGNQGIALDDYGPAGADGVLTVAATGRDDQRLALSNWGAQLDVSAPGEDVVGLRAPHTDLMLKFDVPGYRAGDNVVGDDLGYYRATGTSFATPLVAGVASLLLAARPDLTATDARRMIVQSAADIGTPGLDQLTGYGLLDAQAALATTPEFFIDARIESVSVVQRNRQPRLQVIGTSDADQLADAWLELGQGTDPTDWRQLGLGNAPVRNAVIHELQPQDLAGARQWTLKLVVEHRNGTRREARFALNVQ